MKYNTEKLVFNLIKCRIHVKFLILLFLSGSTVSSDWKTKRTIQQNFGLLLTMFYYTKPYSKATKLMAR